MHTADKTPSWSEYRVVNDKLRFVPVGRAGVAPGVLRDSVDTGAPTSAPSQSASPTPAPTAKDYPFDGKCPEHDLIESQRNATGRGGAGLAVHSCLFGHLCVQHVCT